MRRFLFRWSDQQCEVEMTDLRNHLSECGNGGAKDWAAARFHLAS
jgi:hypothetical protein